MFKKLNRVTPEDAKHCVLFALALAAAAMMLVPIDGQEAHAQTLTEDMLCEMR